MLKNYGVLKGKAIEREMASPSHEHFQIHILAGTEHHRIAINVMSQLSPPEVLFYMDENFVHPITDNIVQANLPDGYTKIPSRPAGIALDFIRGNLFPTQEMKPIPYNQPGADNDLNEKLDFYVQQAINDTDAVVYAFGEKWGPEENKPDQYFGFTPGNGIHDIHMNQGNSGKFKKDNGVYQDGGLLLHFPSRNKWVAIFIAFQVQAWHTDDQTGDPLNTLPPDHPQQPESKTPVRIIAAMVNPSKDDVGKEFVVLFNSDNEAIALHNWRIADKAKLYDVLGNIFIEAHTSLKVRLSGNGAQLSNKGGIISLLDQEGNKIDGVSYTKDQASVENRLIQF
ncbi:DUF2278 family protein [Xanthocytophaga flava]|uniref:DUF2278 family protein n=1 Tax=Xanthocytophaga flava TaxID=3048013 RepID=UPI0028D796C8|nr:DUF2278 family protein [Xanthocytophaga flavus]MDJ1467222.1 DUF2278 family protein [Xanthocytophaga flavus]